LGSQIELVAWARDRHSTSYPSVQPSWLGRFQHKMRKLAHGIEVLFE
jgi:hypothetical protein